MATSDTTTPYEILLRFDEAGMPKGAHFQSRRVVVMDGEIVMDRLLDPESLALAADDTGRRVLADVLAETMGD